MLKAGAGLLAGSVDLWAQGARKPNIIFILADDLGVNGLSCYGADKYKTPHLDRLAAGGTRYTNAYTAPLCGPSRALIMTGRYAFRTGATNQDATGRITPEKETFLPKVLKQADYVSTMIGKWGQLPLGPAEFGFDEHLKFTGSGTYWNSQDKGKNYQLNGEKKPLADKQYLPDVMHDYLVDFMTRHRNRPFYAYYSMSHVHAEILPTPDSSPGSKDHYADNIRYMDKLVGKLVAELDRLKLRENTLVVFVGDNGTGGNFANEGTIGGRRLSGEKGSMLEGGANVPLIVNWPGKTPAGKVSADLIDSTDFFPTFAELAGANPPAGAVIDGRSQAPQWQGRKGQSREWVFIQLARQWYVRDARFKLNQEGALFDMSQAPFAEPQVPVGTNDSAALAARKKLQAALDKLKPAGGILDDGDGTGRHANRRENRKRKDR
jgi:arylsulfatase A